MFSSINNKQNNSIYVSSKPDGSVIVESVVAAFERSVRRSAQSVAVEMGEHRVSYEALEKRANRVAHGIVERIGIQNEPVCALLETGPRYIEGFLGALKAGKAFVPLAPESPDERLRFIVEHSASRILLTQESLLPRAEAVAHSGCTVVSLEALRKGMPDSSVDVRISPNALAIIQYTSGSTGRPKGVVQTHRFLLHANQRYTTSLGIQSSDRILRVPALAFAPGIRSLLGALLNCATLVVSPGDVQTALRETFPQCGMSICHIPPTLLRGLLDVHAGKETPDGLRIFYVAGDSLSRTDVERFRIVFGPDVALTHGFALTEAGSVRQYSVNVKPRLDSTLVPVGYPVQDMEILLVDDGGQSVRPGEIGQIAIRSRYLSAGYWRDPDLTARSFVADRPDAELRTYLTGDLGRMQPDGCLLHLGRLDGQIKLRGQTIALPEIEACLSAHPLVKACAVVDLADSSDNASLVAYIVPCGSPPTTDALKEYLQDRLPRHMVPRVLVMMETLPILAGGKVDRRALRGRSLKDTVSRGPYVAPRDMLERQLAQTWEFVLNVPRISIDEKFFSLGGDSLRAISLLSEVEHLFECRLSTSVLLEAPTIRSMAQVVRDRGVRAVHSVIVPFNEPGSRMPLFLIASADVLSYLQLTHALGPDQPVFVLHPWSVFENGNGPATLEELASVYVRAIRGVRPEGPYLISGMCFGGLLSFQVAQQLRHEGQDVPLLILMDTPMPSHGILPRRMRHLSDRMANHVRKLMQLRGNERVKYFGERFSGLTRRLGLRPASSEQATAPPPSASLWSHIFTAYHRLQRKYRPERYEGAIIHLLAEDTQVGLCDRRLRWNRLARGGIECRLVPGEHDEMLRPPKVTSLADELKQGIDRYLGQTTAHSGKELMS